MHVAGVAGALEMNRGVWVKWHGGAIGGVVYPRAKNKNKLKF